jgi:hypothetical protein
MARKIIEMDRDESTEEIAKKRSVVGAGRGERRNSQTDAWHKRLCISQSARSLRAEIGIAVQEAPLRYCVGAVKGGGKRFRRRFGSARTACN